MKNLETAMKIALASVYTWQLKCHNFHLNITGRDFWELHKMSDEFYKEVWESFDAWAEQLRALDIFAPASLEEFQMLSIIEDFHSVLDSQTSIRELLIDNGKLLNLFREVNNLASDHLGLQNFIQGRCDQHERISWMLRSTIQKEV